MSFVLLEIDEFFKEVITIHEFEIAFKVDVVEDDDINVVTVEEALIGEILKISISSDGLKRCVSGSKTVDKALLEFADDYLIIGKGDFFSIFYE